VIATEVPIGFNVGQTSGTVTQQQATATEQAKVTIVVVLVVSAVMKKGGSARYACVVLTEQVCVHYMVCCTADAGSTALQHVLQAAGRTEGEQQARRQELCDYMEDLHVRAVAGS
jgi:hypothetical protein